jgi:tetratricopeptide (TPR) repeat protein
LGRKYKYLPVGWFWYLGTLLPVIGLVQVGDQPMADRYTYLPLTGLFIIIAWGISNLFERLRYRQVILGTCATIVVFALAFCASLQTGHWRDSKSLYEHALKVTIENYRVCYNFGLALTENHAFDKAIVLFQRAIRLKPDSHQGYSNIGVCYTQLGKWPEAIEAFKQAVKIKPDYVKGHYNLGLAYVNIGDKEAATEQYEILKQLDLESAETLLGFIK